MLRKPTTTALRRILLKYLRNNNIPHEYDSSIGYLQIGCISIRRMSDDYYVNLTLVCSNTFNIDISIQFYDVDKFVKKVLQYHLILKQYSTVAHRYGCVDDYATSIGLSLVPQFPKKSSR